MQERTGAYLIPGTDFRLGVGLAQETEAWGHESLWVTHRGGRDALLALSAYAQATRTIGFPGGPHSRPTLQAFAT